MMELSFKKIALCLLLALFLNVNCIQGLRILGVFPLHGSSHFVMTGRLMRGLVERGHQVDVYSHFPLKKPMPNYTDYSLAGTLRDVKDLMDYEFLSKVAINLPPEMMRMLVNDLCGLLNLPIFQNLINNPPNDPPYDVVIVEMFFANCFLALGRHLKIPMVAMATTTMFDWMNAPLGNPTNLAVEPSIILQRAAPLSFYERLKNVLVSTLITWQYNHFVHAESDALVKKLFGSDFPDSIELQKDVSLLLINYHHALNGIRTYTPAIVPVGGLHIVDDSSSNLSPNVQKFLDESKDGFIYFSFGSMVRFETFPLHIQNAFYNTFKKIAPVRVLMKFVNPENIPRNLSSNIMTGTWFPQIKILKHKNIRAFITHGGLMGTQEAVYYGVPMIGMPLMVDQFFNTHSYAKKNLCIILDHRDITEKTVTEAVTEILKNPIYKQSVEKVSKAFRDTPMSPMDTSIFWIEYIVRHGKDALRSPIVDMPWWQANLLDVYSFLIAATLIVLYAIKVVLKRLIGMFCTKTQYSHSKLKKN